MRYQPVLPAAFPPAAHVPGIALVRGILSGGSTLRSTTPVDVLGEQFMADLRAGHYPQEPNPGLGVDLIDSMSAFALEANGASMDFGNVSSTTEGNNERIYAIHVVLAAGPSGNIADVAWAGVAPYTVPPIAGGSSPSYTVPAIPALTITPRAGAPVGVVDVAVGWRDEFYIAHTATFRVVLVASQGSIGAEFFIFPLVTGAGGLESTSIVRRGSALTSVLVATAPTLTFTVGAVTGGVHGPGGVVATATLVTCHLRTLMAQALATAQYEIATPDTLVARSYEWLDKFNRMVTPFDWASDSAIDQLK